jgi:hypothetical protein
MRRLFSAVKLALREPQAEVHFHKGPDGTPAVCYDARCPSPHLTVD